MTSNSKKALLLLEGFDENKHFGHSVKCFSEFLENNGYETTILETSIYELYDPLIGDDGEAEYSSLPSYLYHKGKVECPDNVRPQDMYSLIYLIFDFEPRYHKYDESKIIKLQEYFDDETRNGRLYLNYPMVESIFDFVRTDRGVEIRKSFPLCDCNSEPYKEHIRKDSVFRNPNNGHLYHYLPDDCFAFAALKSKERYEEIVGCKASEWTVCDSKRLLEEEIGATKSGFVYPLSAFPFLELDYNPEAALANWSALANSFISSTKQ